MGGACCGVWQQTVEGRSPARIVLRRQLSGMTEHNPPAQREPEADSFTFRGEERFEHRADLRRINTRSDILHEELHTGLARLRRDRDLTVAGRVVVHGLA